MTKSELIRRIAHKQSLLAGRDVDLAVKVMLEHMTECLAAGGRIEVWRFGSFSLHFRHGRIGRDPTHGPQIPIWRTTRRSTGNSGLVAHPTKSSLTASELTNCYSAQQSVLMAAGPI